MTPKALTVIARIKSGEEAALETILKEIGSNIKHNTYIKFSESKLIHFARWVIIPNNARRPQLLFACNYDGDLKNFLNELIQIAPGLDQIWGRCEGYSGKHDLLNFVASQSHEPQAFFIAFRDETVESILNYINIRAALEYFLDLKDVTKFLNCSGITPFLDTLSKVSHVVPWWESVGLLGLEVMEMLGEILTAIADFIRNSIIAGANVLIGILGTASNPTGNYEGAETERIQELESGEDRIVQNQMNVITEIQAGRLLRLQIVLLMVDLAAKYFLPPGELLDIRTIHFARWVILDDGSRLLFISNYDGSWENYIGDFVDKVSDGLNAIWNNCISYPEGGAKDIVSFRNFVRKYQIPSQVFYSAYPQETVKNILRDRQISRSLAANFDRDAVERWLELL